MTAWTSEPNESFKCTGTIKRQHVVEKLSMRYFCILNS